MTLSFTEAMFDILLDNMRTHLQGCRRRHIHTHTNTYIRPIDRLHNMNLGTASVQYLLNIILS